MVPPTRLNPFRSPTPEPLGGEEANTLRKCRYFDTLARENGYNSQARIARECGISESCGRKWKQQRMELGTTARRSTRKTSTILGHASKVSKATCKMLVSPSRNPVRKHPLEAQIAFHDLPIIKRQSQTLLKRRTKGGGRYLCAFIKKEISKRTVSKEPSTEMITSMTPSLVTLIILSIQTKHTLTLYHKLKG